MCYLYDLFSERKKRSALRKENQQNHSFMRSSKGRLSFYLPLGLPQHVFCITSLFLSNFFLNHFTFHHRWFISIRSEFQRIKKFCGQKSTFICAQKMNYLFKDADNRVLLYFEVVKKRTFNSTGRNLPYSQYMCTMKWAKSVLKQQCHRDDEWNHITIVLKQQNGKNDDFYSSSIFSLEHTACLWVYVHMCVSRLNSTL